MNAPYPVRQHRRLLLVRVLCAGVVAALTLMAAGGLAQGPSASSRDVLPDGPRPAGSLSLAVAGGGESCSETSHGSVGSDGCKAPQADQGSQADRDRQATQAPGAQQPSPIAPSRVNAGSKATPGPLTQGERTQYVLRQLAAPEHVFGYSAGALLQMASPPGHGSTYYPREWRVGGPGFARNFGDQAARDQAKHLAKYGSGALLREDPRYYPSESSNVVRRAWDALLFTFVDRSNDGERRPALSNLAGAAAAGYVGDAYLPPGFRNQAHATQRSLVSLLGFAAENGEAEFKPEIRAVLRKLHLPFVR